MVQINEFSEFNKAINEHDLCVVKIGAPWCGQCRVVEKNIEEVEKTHPDVYFIDIDVDKVDEVADIYNIRGIPVILIFKGGEIISTTVGIMTVAKLEESLKTL